MWTMWSTNALQGLIPRSVFGLLASRGERNIRISFPPLNNLSSILGPPHSEKTPIVVGSGKVLCRWFSDLVSSQLFRENVSDERTDINHEEQTRLQILNAVLSQQCDAVEAAQLIGVSERHMWRLLAAYRKEGAAALAHGNRDHPPANATPLPLSPDYRFSQWTLSGSKSFSFHWAFSRTWGDSLIPLYSAPDLS